MDRYLIKLTFLSSMKKPFISSHAGSTFLRHLLHRSRECVLMNGIQALPKVYKGEWRSLWHHDPMEDSLNGETLFHTLLELYSFHVRSVPLVMSSCSIIILLRLIECTAYVTCTKLLVWKENSQDWNELSELMFLEESCQVSLSQPTQVFRSRSAQEKSACPLSSSLLGSSWITK